jgi:hypothetical protein
MSARKKNNRARIKAKDEREFERWQKLNEKLEAKRLQESSRR